VTLRITWFTGYGSAVYTNDCAYTVVDTLPRAETPTTPTPSAAPGAAALGSSGTALLGAALAALLPPLFVQRHG
jgi:hypothetical protein